MRRTGAAVVAHAEKAQALGFTAAEALTNSLGTTATDWAAARNFSREQVSMCLNGIRTYHAVRDALAEDLGVSRADLDRLLDGREDTPGS